MTAPTPQPGDEVLIRGRVVVGDEAPEDITVRLWSKVDEFCVPVRRDLVAEVIPATRTRTRNGFTVADTREAIGMVDRKIAKREGFAVMLPSERLILAGLREMRAGLVADLEAVGVPVEDAS